MADLQREIRIRRRVESIYNRSQEDFPDLRSFGDYEEEKEDIIFNLSQGIDVQAMESKIAAYQRQHHDEILMREAKKAEAQRSRLAAKDGVPSSEAQDGAPLDEKGAEGQQAEPEPFKPTEDLPASLPPPPTMLSEDQQEPEASLDPELSAASKQEAIGLVSGWHPDMPRRRAREEAYSSIFVS